MVSYVPAILLLLLAANPATGQLILDGQQIKQVNLEDEGGRWYTLVGTSPIARLKPGQYRVGAIILQGDLTYSPPRDGGQWFTLSPNKPYHLRAGAPLVPQVHVTREGRALRMDYLGVADAGGRLYRGRDSAAFMRQHPTQFAVYRDGQEIASGTLKYGKYG
jgi:hypothetical protein